MMASLAAAPDDRGLGEGGDAEAGCDPQNAGRGQLGLRHPGLGADILVPVVPDQPRAVVELQLPVVDQPVQDCQRSPAKD